MKRYILVIGLIFLVSLPTCSQSRSERKALKKELKTKEYEQTKELLDNGAFFFNAEWMYPRNSNQVNLIGNPGYITFKETGDLDMYLPYFGIVRIGGGYNQSVGIQHKGIVKSYKIVHDEAKQSSYISFTAKTPSEIFDITMTVYTNGNTSVFINSSKRDAIRYRGVISPLEKALVTDQ